MHLLNTPEVICEALTLSEDSLLTLAGNLVGFASNVCFLRSDSDVPRIIRALPTLTPILDDSISNAEISYDRVKRIVEIATDHNGVECLLPVRGNPIATTFGEYLIEFAKSVQFNALIVSDSGKNFKTIQSIEDYISGDLDQLSREMKVVETEIRKGFSETYRLLKIVPFLSCQSVSQVYGVKDLIDATGYSDSSIRAKSKEWFPLKTKVSHWSKIEFLSFLMRVSQEHGENGEKARRKISQINGKIESINAD